jgi:hypothetical protein
MRFEIPFDKEIFVSQNKLWFDYVWSKNVKKNKSGFYYGIASLILGTFIVYGNDNLGFVFIVFGLFLIITAYRYYNHYKKRKKMFFDSIESTIQEYKNSGLGSVFELNDDIFCYKDYRFEVKINWITFAGYKLIQNNLFIFFDKEKQMPYVICKEETNKDDFDNIIEFLNNKKSLL